MQGGIPLPYKKPTELSDNGLIGRLFYMQFVCGVFVMFSLLNV